MFCVLSASTKIAWCTCVADALELKHACHTHYTLSTAQVDQVAAAVSGQQHDSKAVTTSTPTTLTPSLSQITAFFRHIYHKSKLNVDCIILSLIYVERLLKDTQGQLRPTAKNWKSLLMASLILASKVKLHISVQQCNL
jgi:pyruvate/oxaloacetate carboxyltransferase